MKFESNLFKKIIIPQTKIISQHGEQAFMKSGTEKDFEMKF